MSHVAILGSGFGLYGYLPALAAGCGRRVVLPVRYQARFRQRAELSRFAGSIDWVADELSALKAASSAVLALCPQMQQRWLSTCLDLPNLQHLFLEKPLAATPRAAEMLHEKLHRSGQIVRVSYLFRYLDWVTPLRRFLSSAVSDARVAISWQFHAHHFRHDLSTWKRYHDQGGGAIRFYGIHLIALLAELGYTRIELSNSSGPAANQPSQWHAEFSGEGLMPCEVQLNSRATTSEFSISARHVFGSEALVRQDDPFSATAQALTPGEVDRRVSVIGQHCQSAWDDAARLPEFYRAAIDLWRQVEAVDAWQVIRVAA